MKYGSSLNNYKLDDYDIFEVMSKQLYINKA
jgi:hypothetical protein